MSGRQTKAATELAKRVEELESKIAQQSREQRELVATFQRVEFRSGPVPSAEELEHYNSVLPGGADRIFTMAEKEQSHRHKMDREDAGSATRGQWMGFSIAMILIVCGTWLIAIGGVIEGSLMAGGSAVALVALFLRQREKDE